MVLVPTAYAPSSNNKTSSWRTTKPVIDYGKCTRCMICWKFCPDVAIGVTQGMNLEFPNERFAKMEAPYIDYDYCKGCGICANECPFDAIDMVQESEM